MFVLLVTLYIFAFQGPFPFEGEEDPDLINAGEVTVSSITLVINLWYIIYQARRL